MNNLTCADDTALIIHSQEKLQEMASVLVRESESEGMKVNVSKKQMLFGLQRRYASSG